MAFARLEPFGARHDEERFAWLAALLASGYSGQPHGLEQFAPELAAQQPEQTPEEQRAMLARIAKAVSDADRGNAERGPVSRCE